MEIGYKVTYKHKILPNMFNFLVEHFKILNRIQQKYNSTQQFTEEPSVNRNI